MKSIVLTGGGTAGHVIPNLALIPELKKFFDKIYYFGGNGIEKYLAEKANIPFYETTVVKFDRRKILSNFKIPILLQKGISEAKKILTKLSPDVIFSKGGYAALPVCFAAKMLGIPVICHESDYSMGLANKIVSLFAKKTLTSFPETKGGIYVGNPVRQDFFNQSTSQQSNLPMLDSKKRTLLICGGSTGSTAINKVIYSALPELLKKYNIIHISGNNGDFSVSGSNYYQYKYADNYPSLLKRADCVVCRAGSNTLTEAAALGKKCITIPLPKGVSRGDQILNAKSFQKRGYCKILFQDNLCVQSLIATINSIWNNSTPAMNVLQINKNIVNHIISAI